MNTHGDISFFACMATVQEAGIIGTNPGEAMFIIKRTTWDHDTAITTVRLAFAPGYSMRTVI